MIVATPIPTSGRPQRKVEHPFLYFLPLLVPRTGSVACVPVMQHRPTTLPSLYESIRMPEPSNKHKCAQRTRMLQRLFDNASFFCVLRLTPLPFLCMLCQSPQFLMLMVSSHKHDIAKKASCRFQRSCVISTVGYTSGEIESLGHVFFPLFNLGSNHMLIFIRA